MYLHTAKKVVATIEARMASSRLPGKVLMPLVGKPVLERMIERIKPSKFVDEIVIATTVNKPDDEIDDLAKSLGVKCFRGSEEDVLSRVLGAAKSVSADVIIELTGDCPLSDYRLIDQAIAEFFKRDVDYLANNMEPLTFANGFDAQVFPVRVLEEVSNLTHDPRDREHVTYYIYTHPEKYKTYSLQASDEDLSGDLRVTLDEKNDLMLIENIFERLLLIDPLFSYKEVIKLLRENPTLVKINKNVKQKKV
ncbi:MAG: glycosyltransferase family protein [Candidatus Vogelbacteria bacterium]|nr:glycosyltransferase family protein [Candidatus Vogelbacteria bacterium]